MPKMGETRFHSPHYQSMTHVTRNSRIASIPEESEIFAPPILQSTELSGSGFYQDCDSYIALLQLPVQLLQYLKR
jgi:hypothetical protein